MDPSIVDRDTSQPKLSQIVIGVTPHTHLFSSSVAAAVPLGGAQRGHVCCHGCGTLCLVSTRNVVVSGKRQSKSD